MSARFGRITWPPSRWQISQRRVAKAAAVTVVAAAGVFAFLANNAAESPKAVPLDASSLVPVLTNTTSSRTATPKQTKAAPTPSPAVKQTQPSPVRPPMSMPTGFSFTGFPDNADAASARLNGPDKLWTNGSATVAGRRLVLASGRDKAGSAWSTFSIDPSRSFSTAFSFEITKISDGIAFVVQNAQRPRGPGPFAAGVPIDGVGGYAIGASGEGLGYGDQPGDADLRIQPSLAVEFDTWVNTFDPADHQHVAVTRNGDITQHLVWKDPGFSLYGQGVVNVWIDYDAGAHRLRVYISKSSLRPADPLFTYPVDLRKTIGGNFAYVGLTGGTGITTVADPVEAVSAWNLRAET